MEWPARGLVSVTKRLAVTINKAKTQDREIRIIFSFLDSEGDNDSSTGHVERRVTRICKRPNYWVGRYLTIKKKIVASLPAGPHESVLVAGSPPSVRWPCQ